MKLKHLSITVRCVIAAILTALPAGAAINFTFDYSGTGNGF